MNRPDVLLVMNDGMGFSDIGCYGGEVRTPNLGRLAADGVRFTHFYNTAGGRDYGRRYTRRSNSGALLGFHG